MATDKRQVDAITARDADFAQWYTDVHGNPGALRGEALHMVLLLLEQGLGDQHREIDVLMARLLEATSFL